MFLFEVPKTSSGPLFCHQLTYEGLEGGLPELFMSVSASCGFRLDWDGAGQVLLRQVQERLDDSAFGASMYSDDSGGMQNGVLFSFQPVFEESSAEGAVLVDLAPWFQSFFAKAMEAHDTADIDHTFPQHTCHQHSLNCGHHAHSPAHGVMPSCCFGNEVAKVWAAADYPAITDAENTPPGCAMAKGSYTSAGRAQPFEWTLVETGSFPRNLFFRIMATKSYRQPRPFKTAKVDATRYFRLSLCLLPSRPSSPRLLDPRVGYFRTSLTRGAPDTISRPLQVINRWDLTRRGGHITFHIDPGVPLAYRETVKAGVLAWNKAFETIGQGVSSSVVKCVAPGDADWPQDYSPGDVRYSSIFMCDPTMTGLLGYGPRICDFRSGEILCAHILIAFSAFTRMASKHDLEVLTPSHSRLRCGAAMPLLKAGHPGVLMAIRKTVVHEVGHALGLRHNFIGCEDGNSSVMAYADPLDTLGEPGQAVFGGHFLTTPGVYDAYAIRYGYTPLQGESLRERHKGLDLLANGQLATDVGLDSRPLNPLFATDNDVGVIDPRVATHIWHVRGMGSDKIDFALARRQLLLRKVTSRQIFSQTYEKLMVSLTLGVARRIAHAAHFIGGRYVDRRRHSATPTTTTDVANYVASGMRFLLGELFRPSPSESKHMMRSVYVLSLSHTDLTRMQSLHAARFVLAVTNAERLGRLESQHAEAGGRGRLDTLQLLRLMAYGPRAVSVTGMDINHPPHLTALWPLRPDHTQPQASALNVSGKCVLRSELRLSFARRINALLFSTTHNAMSVAAAWAFLEECNQLCDSVLSPDTGGLLPIARASWKLFAFTLNRNTHTHCTEPMRARL